MKRFYIFIFFLLIYLLINAAINYKSEKKHQRTRAFKFEILLSLSKQQRMKKKTEKKGKLARLLHQKVIRLIFVLTDCVILYLYIYDHILKHLKYLKL